MCIKWIQRQWRKTIVNSSMYVNILNFWICLSKMSYVIAGIYRWRKVVITLPDAPSTLIPPPQQQVADASWLLEYERRLHPTRRWSRTEQLTSSAPFQSSTDASVTLIFHSFNLSLHVFHAGLLSDASYMTSPFLDSGLFTWTGSHLHGHTWSQMVSTLNLH